MRDVLHFETGLRWILVETEEDACRAARLIGGWLLTGFVVDQDRGHRSSHFVLADAEMDMGYVMVRVGEVPNMLTANDGKLVWGANFTDPWPQFADEIRALSEGIGVELHRRHCPIATTVLATPRM